MPSLKSITSAFCFCLLMTFCAVLAKADVTYDFVGTGAAFHFADGKVIPPEPLAFQLTVPTFISPVLNAPLLTFECAQLSPTITNLDCRFPVAFGFNSGFPAGFRNGIGIDAVDDVAYGFFFSTGAFGAPGVYAALQPGSAFGPGTLTVTETNVPEPSSALLLAVALIGFAGLALVKRPSLKNVVSAFCFCLLMMFCAGSAKADTTYTYTGAQFFEFGAAVCPPTCNITGSFTLATPLPTNAVGVAINTFAFSAGPYTFTSLTNGPFGVSTNAAGVIDSWSIDMVDELGGGVAEISSGAPTFDDELEFGADDGLGDGGLKFFFGADAGAIGFWTASTSTGVPEPASGTLLIAGLVGLAGLALKKSL